MLGRNLAGCCGLIALLAGCGGSTDDARGNAIGGGPESLTPLPECSYTNFGACDILKPDCQDFLMGLATCMRGSKPAKSLTVDELSEDDFVAVLRQDYADSPQTSTAHLGQALASLGLAKASTFMMQGDTLETQIKALAQSIAGEYRPKEKRIIIIDRGQPQNSIDNDLVMVHEMVHALQDVDVDLASVSDDVSSVTFDQGLALISVYEGEAQFYALRASVPFDGYDIRHTAFRSGLLDITRDACVTAAQSDQPYWTSRMVFPYTFGALQAYDAWHTGGPRGIDVLYGKPPTTTQSVLASALSKDEPQARPDPLMAPALDPLMLTDDESLGGWGLLLFLTKQEMDFINAGTAATAWRNDRLWAYTDDTGVPTFALWEIELGNAQAASDLDDALEQASQQAPVPFTHGTKGDRAFVSLGFSDPPNDSVTAAGTAWLSGH